MRGDSLFGARGWRFTCRVLGAQGVWGVCPFHPECREGLADKGRSDAQGEGWPDAQSEVA